MFYLCPKCNSPMDCKYQHGLKPLAWYICSACDYTSNCLTNSGYTVLPKMLQPQSNQTNERTVTE